MIQQFSEYLYEIRGYSANTTRAYTTDLRTFVKWAHETGAVTRWSEVTRQTIDEYIKQQNRAGKAATTTNRQIASLSSFFTFLKRQGYEVENPCRYESRRKVAQTLPNVLKLEQLKRAYTNAIGAKKTMLGLLATTGMRIQELLDMKYEDINFETAEIRINGKGNKARIVTTEKAVLYDLERCWIENKASGKVFWIGQRAARTMIKEVLQPYCRSKHLNPHTIRHTYATELAKAGATSASIAKALGHEHIATSEKYINLAEVSNCKGIVKLTK